MAITGGVNTMRDADADRPVPPSVDVTLLVVLFLVPGVVPVTFTANVQDPLAASVPPVRATLLPPAVAVIVPVPHEPVSPLGVETTRPDGKLSLKATPLRLCAVFGLLMVKLSEVDAVGAMLAAPKALVIAGGPTTMIAALAILPGPPSFDVI